MGTILSITEKIDNGAGGVGRRMPTEITVRGRSGASEPPERGTVHATGSAHIEVEFRDFTALSWWITAHTEGVRISDVEWSLSIRRGRRLRNAECRPFAGWRPRSTHGLLPAEPAPDGNVSSHGGTEESAEGGSHQRNEVAGQTTHRDTADAAV